MASIHRAREQGPGPVVFDPTGCALTAEEREMFAHPLVGGVVLFRHNYHDPAQLRELVRSCRAAHKGPLVVMVDHEGGRVQRFREGFTALPPASALGDLHAADPERAVEAARAVGRLMALELEAVGIDLNLAPVLDIAGEGDVIGNRAYSECAATVSALATSVMRGLHDGGLGAVAKHFPGHGGVVQDTHHESAVDPRPLDAVRAADLVPFIELVTAGVDGVLPAHVSFPAVDDEPVGYSARWLQDELRGHMAFDGLIISDDLSMAAAQRAGGVVEAASAAMAAGCDMVLSCQVPAAAVTLLDRLQADVESTDRVRRVAQFDSLRRSRRCAVDRRVAEDRVQQLTQTLEG